MRHRDCVSFYKEKVFFIIRMLKSLIVYQIYFFFFQIFYQSRELKSLLNYNYFHVNDFIVCFKDYILILSHYII